MKLASTLFATYSLGVLALFVLQYWDLLPKTELVLLVVAAYVVISLALFARVQALKKVMQV